MKLPYTKTVDGVTYTLTHEPSLTSEPEQDYLWRAFDGSGAIMGVTVEEINEYELD